MMDTKNTANVASWIRKKMSGTISPQEQFWLDNWVRDHPEHIKLLQDIEKRDILWSDVICWLELERDEDPKEWDNRLSKNTLSKIHNTSTEVRLKVKKHFGKQLLLYAAVTFFLFFTGLSVFYFHSVNDKQKTKIVYDFAPGSNRAQITLSTGDVIDLSEDQEGIILGQALTYEDGSLITSLPDDGQIVFSQLKTPRGGKYRVMLSDGTEVWLNADSKLTYPTKFGNQDRIVELEGEAYFKVAPIKRSGKKIPFIVKTSQQQIEVLGTEFNVMAYQDEDTKHTTLVEGSVTVHDKGNQILLAPGEQVISDNKGVRKMKVNVESFIAWKDNIFYFNETELHTALQELSRWYDFDIIYQSDVSPTHFYGSIGREKGLAEVLKIMESGGVKFQLKKGNGRNLVIVN